MSAGCLTLYVLHRFSPKQQAKRKINSAHENGAENKALVKPTIKLLVGFAIAKKVLKSACKRNRCKRRAREAYRSVRSEEELVESLKDGVKSWYALVFVIKPEALEVSFEDIKNAARECLVKANRKYGRLN